MSLLTAAFAALRSDNVGTDERWRPVYRRALVDAFEQDRVDEAAELAAFAATALEAQGRYQDAVAELEFAIPRASGSIDASVILLATLAATHSFSSNREAFHALEAAQALRPHLEDPYTRHQLNGLEATVQLVFLAPGGVESAIEAARAAREAGYPWIGQGLDIWAIPAIAASGSLRRARPWTQVLAAEAEATKSIYRRADAAAIQFCLDTARGGDGLDEESLDRAPRNRMARWRAHTAALRSDSLRGDLEGARHQLAAMRSLAPHVNPGHAWSLPAFEAIIATDDARCPDLTPPNNLTLVNLPGVLAALEIVVAGGVSIRRWDGCDGAKRRRYRRRCRRSNGQHLLDDLSAC